MKLTQDALDCMILFEKKTGAPVKDCIINGNSVTFIVKKQDIGNAIGKGGMKVKKIKDELKKEIHVYAFSEKPEEFAKNLLYPIKINDAKIENDTLKLHIDKNEKKRAIGRNGKKINTVKELLKRHSNINKIEVL